MKSNKNFFSRISFFYFQVKINIDFSSNKNLNIFNTIWLMVIEILIYLKNTTWDDQNFKKNFFILIWRFTYDKICSTSIKCTVTYCMYCRIIDVNPVK